MYRVKIFVLEETFDKMLHWLRVLSRTPIGYTKYKLENFVWHSPRCGNPDSKWHAEVLVEFLEEEDALAFKLRFKTRDD